MTQISSQPDLLDFPHGDLLRLRLLLQRRVLWLRDHWQEDGLHDRAEQVISDVQADWLLSKANRQTEWAFYWTHPEAIRLTAMIRETMLRLRERDERLRANGSGTPLQRLALILNLSPFDQDVLLLGLAPEVEPGVGQLYGYVQDDAARRLPTVELALLLFTAEEAEWADARLSFLPQAPLRYWQLLHLEPAASATLAGSVFRLDHRIADYLLGINRLDERAGFWLQEIMPEPLALIAYPAALETAETIIRDWVGRRQGPWPVINLFGPVTVDKQFLARAVCERIGGRLYEIDLTSLPSGGPERNLALRLIEREGLLQPAAFYLEAYEVLPGQSVADLAALVAHLGAMLFLGTARPWTPAYGRLNRAIRFIETPMPDASVQRKMWEQALGGVAVSLDGHLDEVVEQFQFGPAQVRRAAESAAARGRARRHFEPDDVWQACREQAGGHLDELAQRITPCYMWSDIVVPDDVLSQLREIAAQVANRAKVYEGWGFGAKLNRGRGISALFSGPSGVGKTMAAEVLANHLQLDLYRIDLSSVVSKYIGETEKNLRRVFDAAEGGGAILFFDEADALFGKRSEVRDSHDRYANIEINYLLQRMEDYRGLAILATNMRSAIDTAFMRRLRFVVEMPFPDAALRERIWRSVFPPQAQVGQLDYALLSRWEIAGGNIRNIALNAAFQAADRGEPIQMTHLVNAARREYAKIHKLLRDSELGALAAGPGR